MWGATGTGQIDSGAAYVPSTRSWRRLSELPASVERSPSPEGIEGVWTGDAALFMWFGDTDGAGGLVSYDPAEDRWQQLATPPVGARQWGEAIWSGRELYVVGGGIGDSLASPVVVAYDPARDQWRDLPDPPFPNWAPWAVEWASDRLVLVGGMSSETGTVQDPGTSAAGAVFDPATGSWAAMASGPTGDAPHTTVVNQRVVALSETSVDTYDAALDSWRSSTSDAPVDPGQVHSLHPFRDDALAVTFDHRVFLIDLDRGEWSPLTHAEERERGGQIAILADDDLVVWGGSHGDGGTDLGDGIQYSLRGWTANSPDDVGIEDDNDLAGSLLPEEVAPVPVPGEPMSDGTHLVHIGKVDLERRVLDVDVVERYTGDAADRAYDEDTGDNSGAPNDYYIRNADNELRAVPLDDSPRVSVAWDTSGPRQHTIALSELPRYLDERNDPEAPFWLSIEDGVATHIAEMYRP